MIAPSHLHSQFDLDGLLTNRERASDTSQRRALNWLRYGSSPERNFAASEMSGDLK
jgi:hypothetical protein